MKDNQGWVKISRKLLNNPIFQKPDYLTVWLFLLLSANHEETSFIWNNKKQILKKGQLLTGLKVMAKKTGVAQGTVYRILKYLENEKQIEQQKTTKFTVITIVNWSKYQGNEKQNEKQIENRLKTNEKQIETYKNVNKNVEKVSTDIFKDISFKAELSKQFNLSTTEVQRELDTMQDWLKSTGKKYKDYKAFARNWLRRRSDDKGVKKESINLLNTKYGK